MNRKAFIRILELNGVILDHHGAKHDIYKHIQTGKKIPIPRHNEFSNVFLKDVLKEIPRK